MEETISNCSSKTENILNKNSQIEDSDLLITKKIKNKKQQLKKKYTSLNDSLDNNSKKKLNKTIKGKNLNDKNDISDFSGKSKIVRDIFEFNFNEFGKFNIPSKFGINSNDNKNIFGVSTENKEYNNIDNNKRKIIDPICDYYSECDKYLKKTETSIIDLSTSLNFIKKEKFKENFYDNFENYNSNININNINDDLVNNNYRINSKYNLKYLKDSKNNGITKKIVANSKQSKFIFYNKYYVNYKFNRNYIDITGDWQCGNCGNYNFSFRDFCNRCNNPKL